MILRNTSAVIHLSFFSSVFKNHSYCSLSSVGKFSIEHATSGNVAAEIHTSGSGLGNQLHLHNDHGLAYVGQAGDTTGDFIIYNGSSSNMLFSTNASERMRIGSDGFLGINFHYLPIPLRVKLLNSLVSGFANNSKLDESTRLNVSYDSIGKRSLVKPTLHKYLKTNLRSQFRRIDADEFVIATLLPVQQFRKATANKVWSDSRKMV